MAITDELRKWAQICGIKYDSKLYEIADHIDAAHCKALGETAAAAYAEGVESVPIAVDENAWVRLPMDADGVPIHVGDVMENIVCPSVHREATGVGVECFYGWDEDNARYSQFDAVRYRHRHASTVEDVLRQFAREIDADAYGITDAKVAEFAAKLRLAGDE